ncbi:uncharacterized protein LOC129110992 isoform X2 [Anoplopoma fimbria]|nr:uncharacterized protein LOC129110992 isoform X2 [Anoplopoma fimbria]
MDISLLREQYRSTRETQRRHTHVLLLRTVSLELSEAVSVVPVSQALTSPWEPHVSSSPAVTFDPGPMTFGDPWHVHLGLHRRCRPGVTTQLPAPSLETTNSNSSSRRPSSSSESSSRKLSVDSTSDSPCSSSCSTTEEVNADGSRADPGTGSSEGSRADPGTGSSEGSRADAGTGSSEGSRSRADPDKTDPVQVSVSGSPDPSEQSPSDGSREHQTPGSDVSSTPVASISSSSTSLHEDLKGGQSVLQTGIPSAWWGSRKFSASALRFTRQLSVGGVGSSTGVHQNQNQNQNYHPFPNRKTPRISEAARKLGMYSSF